jgi:endonuclease/exonuclease/phosphatase family metal-dependent hydrolase
MVERPLRRRQWPGGVQGRRRILAQLPPGRCHRRQPSPGPRRRAQRTRPRHRRGRGRPEPPRRTATLLRPARTRGRLAGDGAADPKQSQCIGIATRIDQGKFNAPAFTSLAIPGADPFAPFELDTDDDGIAERYHFERRPLYVEVSPAGAAPFRILGLHLKSKGIFKAFEWSQWWQVADANRRKILAQAGQIRRQFLDQYMTDAATRDIPLIVCGDINDGPGLDASEKRLFGSGIERLMGSIWKPNLCLSNALFDALPPDDQASLAFDKIVTTNFKDPIFNNTWHNEWIDHLLHTHAQAGWVTNARTHGQMQNGPIWREYRFASDHYPVSATLTV